MTKECIGIIGGTGLGEALEAALSHGQSRDVDTPFGKPSGPVMIGQLGRRRIAFLNRHGVGHGLNPSRVPYAANIFALKTLGVRTLIASGAAGSLQEHIVPGDLVLVDQFIDKTFRRTGSFFNDYGSVHCEMTEPVCARLQQVIAHTARSLDVKTHDKGTYVCMEGPQFSTRAESLMHRIWGGDVIGMTGMPEAKLAREAQMCYCLVALASDYDCWQAHDPCKGKQTILAEILANLQTATRNCLELIRAVLAVDQDLLEEDCPCRKSLELAVWTPKEYIDQKKHQQLSVLFE